jgi:hypothetical protein
MKATTKVFAVIVLSCLIIASTLGFHIVVGASDIPPRWTYTVAVSNYAFTYTPGLTYEYTTEAGYNNTPVYRMSFSGGPSTGVVVFAQYTFGEVLPAQDIRINIPYKGTDMATATIQLYAITSQGTSAVHLDLPSNTTSLLNVTLSVPSVDENGNQIQGITGIGFLVSRNASTVVFRLPSRIYVYDMSSGWANQWKNQQDQSRHDDIIGTKPPALTTVSPSTLPAYSDVTAPVMEAELLNGVGVVSGIMSAHILSSPSFWGALIGFSTFFLFTAILMRRRLPSVKDTPSEEFYISGYTVTEKTGELFSTTYHRKKRR